jgi:hypothetical protein
MKNLLCLALALFTLTAFAQKKSNPLAMELPVKDQPSEKLQVRLFAHRYSTLGSQSFSMQIKNISDKPVGVRGSVVATLTNGRTKKTSFNIRLKPGESKGGDSFLLDNHGLTGEVFKEDCEGEKIQAPDAPGQTRVNRIKRVGWDSLVLTNPK